MIMVKGVGRGRRIEMTEEGQDKKREGGGWKRSEEAELKKG